MCVVARFQKLQFLHVVLYIVDLGWGDSDFGDLIKCEDMLPFETVWPVNFGINIYSEYFNCNF